MSKDMPVFDDERFLNRGREAETPTPRVERKTSGKKRAMPPLQLGDPDAQYELKNGITQAIQKEAVAPEPPVELVLLEVPPTEPRRTKRIPLSAMKRSSRPQMPMPAVGAEQPEKELWERLPTHIRLLAGLIEPPAEELYDDAPDADERQQFITQILNPPLTLEEVAVLLGVTTATVRRYTNKGLLPHTRTVGQQRRFRLDEVLAFLEKNGGGR
jgi:excisionase family DNA binding protein